MRMSQLKVLALVLGCFWAMAQDAGNQPKVVIYITGGVIRPGPVEFAAQDIVSIVQLLRMAGGLARAAVPEKTRIIHTEPNGERNESMTVNLKMIMAGKARDIQLLPGDHVIVPLRPPVQLYSDPNGCGYGPLRACA